MIKATYQTPIDTDKGYVHQFKFALGYRVRQYHTFFSWENDIDLNNYKEGIICGGEESCVSAKYHEWHFIIDRVIINGQVCSHSWLNGKVSSFYENSKNLEILSKKIQPIIFGNPQNFSWK